MTASDTTIADWPKPKKIGVSLVLLGIALIVVALWSTPGVPSPIESMLEEGFGLNPMQSMGIQWVAIVVVLVAGALLWKSGTNKERK